MSIGVVVPVYNVEKWLDRCLESLINQTKSFDKIVIVDDGSVDRSGQIIDSYLDIADNIVVVHQSNKGLGAARNIGLKSIDSRYVLFVDSDDYVRHDLCEILEKRIDSCKERNLDAIYFDAAVVIDDLNNVDNEKTRKYIRNISFKDNYVTGVDFLKLSFLNNYYPTAWGCLYRTELIKKIGFREHVLFEDNYTTFAYMIACETVDCISEQLYFYRQRDGSIMTSPFETRMFDDYCIVANDMYEHMSYNKTKLLQAKRAIGLLAFRICCSVFKYYKMLLCDKSMNNSDIIEKTKSFYCLGNMYLQILSDYKISYKESVIYSYIDLLKMICDIEYSFSNLMEIKEIKEKYLNALIKSYGDLFANYGIELFGAGKIYGIYGVGKHTDGMTMLIDDFFSKRKACFKYYISDDRMNSKVIPNYVEAISSIDYDLDAIIISSSIYGEEMIKTVRNTNSDIQIIWFYEYEKRDLFTWYSDMRKILVKI